MNSRYARHPAYRWLASLMSGLLALGPLVDPAYAAQTSLADIPIASKVTTKPNIVYTLDDSGSMQFNYSPDWVIATAYCRSGNNVIACTANNSNYTTTFQSPPFYAADFNRLAYNPNVVYTPPVKANGLPLTHTIGTDTDVNGNQINLAKVQTDPFTAPAIQINLTGAVAVPLYCNTDWPLTAAVNLTLTNDVGDVNGEYKAGTGAWCRINGTKYDLSAASAAPAVIDDYNYPYQLSAGANGTQYFYRQLSNKILYCDATSPYWPRNGVIVGCTAGGTPTCGGLPCPSTQQKCNQKAKTCNPTVALRNYTPAACVGNPLYCGPYGTGSSPECLACACNSDFQPAGGTCSITGAACAGPFGVLGGDPACPNQPTAPNGCSLGVPIYSGAAASANCTSLMFDPAAGVYSGTPPSLMPATTLLQDSNGPGVACRHNNQVYAVTGAPAAGTPFTYPRTLIGDVAPANRTGIAPYTQAGKFITATTGGCPTVGTTINIPRHYYTIDSVTFCNAVDGTVNGPWRGFGAGVCPVVQANDLTTYKNVKYGQHHRVGLYAAHAPYPYVDQLTGASLSRTYAQEIINYANWYAYYRLRAHAAKTTSSLSFNLLDNTYRVGFHTLGSEPVPIGTGLPVTWVNVGDFDLAQKTAWWAALFAVPTATNYKTPMLSAMLRIGNLFETGGAAGLPASVASLPGGTTDPFVKDGLGNPISCQSSFHILFTDGFTNQVALPAVAGEQDDLVPSFAAMPDILPDSVLPNLRPLSGLAWPRPFRWGTFAVPNTLSDVGTYYWARDLRPALKNNVPAAPGKTPNDVDPNQDVAWWQHVEFSAISFGAAGTLDAINQAATLGNITSGVLQWPNLSTPNNPPLPATNRGAVAVDDLWHATVNARGAFVYAESPLEVQYGIAGILSRISNQRKSRSGAAFSGQVLSALNNIIYEPTIEQGWAGDLLKVQIDPTDGHELATLWRASAVLSDQIRPTAVGDEPWLDESKRRIVSWNGATKVAFRAVAAGILPPLSAAQLNTLSLDPITQKKMVAYLRGGYWANPPLTIAAGTVIEGTSIGQYRKRFGAAPATVPKPFTGGAGLGDISNAQPLVVSAPIPDVFYESSDPGFFTFSHVTAAGRPDRIVAAANDGMVHIVDAADGHELFAYVPSSLLRTTVDSLGHPTGMQALTLQDGGVPIYKHHFYVDSSPRTVNVDFNSAGVKGGAPDWHTIVVGGMGKGGNSYYALDLTDPSTTTEAQAASKLLWEVTDPDWRYTYGRPVIAKTYAYGWTVFVTSGYNNVSEEGRLYFLDPKTGAPLRAPMSVGKSCGAGNPAGLAQINGFTKDFHNQFAEQIYGGDLCGNFWRFNISDPNPVNWTVDKFAVLKDPGGTVQPITTAPQIEITFANGTDRFVFIGTGQLLDAVDLTTPSPAQQQTLYAFRDGSLSTPMPSASLPILNPRGTLAAVPAGGGPIAAGAPNGWYHDLPIGANAERIVIDVEADANVVTYIGTQVPNDPCVIALPADIYAREFDTGEALLWDGSGNPWYYDAAGGVGIQVVGLTDPVTGAITLGGLLSHEIPGTAPLKFKNPLFGGRNRFSWRLLTGE